MFGRRNPVDDSTADWVVDRMVWLTKALGPDRFFSKTRLILPEPGALKTPPGRDQATAQGVTSELASLMGLTDVPDVCEMPDLPPEYRHSYQALSEAAGTYQQDDDGRATIHYRPEQLADPIHFIATISHELAHHLLAAPLATAEDLWEGHELLTDLAAIHAGFGVFQIVSADRAGWAGYLRQETRAFALALFLRAKGIEPDATLKHLPRRIAKATKASLTMLDRNPEDIAAVANLKA